MKCCYYFWKQQIFNDYHKDVCKGVAGEANDGEPLEAQCRPYIEEALKKLETGETPTGNKIIIY